MRCPSDYCQKGETDHEGRAPFVEYGHEAAGGPPDEDEVRSAESAPLGDTSDLARPSAPALEVPEPHIQKCETGSSRSAEMTHPEVPVLHPNYKDKRKKEKSRAMESSIAHSVLLFLKHRLTLRRATPTLHSCSLAVSYHAL